MPSFYYPVRWIRQTPLTALPGKFCCGPNTDVNKTITDYFLDGHPLNLLACRVCFVCDSDKHKAMCPNNVTCLFGENDFDMVYSAIKSSGVQRPNLQSELESWARRALNRNAGALLRLMNKFPELCTAVASAVTRKRRADGSLAQGPVSVIYSLICSGHIPLDLISLNWVASIQQDPLITNFLPTSAEIGALCAFNTWGLYLEGRSKFKELPKPFRIQIATMIAFLCTASLTSLPVLPSELGNIIYLKLMLTM